MSETTLFFTHPDELQLDILVRDGVGLDDAEEGADDVKGRVASVPQVQKRPVRPLEVLLQAALPERGLLARSKNDKRRPGETRRKERIE